MLNDHTIGQAAYQHRAQLEGAAQAHRLVLEARGIRQRRVWRRELARELERFLGLVAAPSRRAGTSC
jgi:broad specificity phosphatase PhoE